MRLILPLSSESKSCIWRTNSLFSLGRTAEVNQMRGGDMYTIEDAEALPSTDDHVGAQGPQKSEQLGSEAAGALLRAQLDGVDLSKMDAIVIEDLRVRTGDLFDAFMSLRSSYCRPLFYIGMCDSMTEMQWVQQHMERSMAQKIANGEIAVPGFTAKPLECPADLLGDPPALPHLANIILGGARKLQPQVPNTILKTYLQHPKFGAEFEKMLNNFNDEFGIPEPDCKVDDDEKLRTPSKKRGVPNDSATPTTNKKVKANPLTLTELKDLTDALKCECAVPSFKGGCEVKLQVRTAKIYMVNTSLLSGNLAAHSWLCGLPRGQFKLITQA